MCAKRMQPLDFVGGLPQIVSPKSLLVVMRNVRLVDLCMFAQSFGEVCHGSSLSVFAVVPSV
jgi:hypothetical protein